MPLDWAATQYNLGITLTRLGEIESGTEHLQEAVAVFRTALEGRTRDRHPHNWANTQKSLAEALIALGQREHEMKYIKEAVNIC